MGTFEFAGSHEPDGWEVVGSIVPFAYIAWSIWLLAVGICLVLGLHRGRASPARQAAFTTSSLPAGARS